MERIFQSGWVVGALAVVIAGVGAVAGAAAQTPPPYLGSFPNFEAQLTPQQLPGDVDVALKHRLEGEQKFPEVQRLFDLWSWQAFISLNWPTDASGKRTGDATQPPAWTLWTGSTHVFLPRRAAPRVQDGHGTRCSVGGELGSYARARLRSDQASGATRLPARPIARGHLGGQRPQRLGLDRRHQAGFFRADHRSERQFRVL